MCGPVVEGCKHVAAGSKPQVILADDDGRISHVMCKECADWFDEVGCTLDAEQMLALGRVGFVCLSCLSLGEKMQGPGFWLLNEDGNTYSPQTAELTQ